MLRGLDDGGAGLRGVDGLGRRRVAVVLRPPGHLGQNRAGESSRRRKMTLLQAIVPPLFAFALQGELVSRDLVHSHPFLGRQQNAERKLPMKESHHARLGRGAQSTERAPSCCSLISWDLHPILG